MKTIKRIGAVGGAISLALCWPLAVGQIGQNVITDGVNHIDNDKVKAEVVSYDRGYLTSTVQTRYSIVDPAIKLQMEAEGMPTEVVMHSEVHHGLLSLTAVSTFPDYPDFPMVINSTTRLNGNMEYTAQTETWHYANNGENPFTLSVTPMVFKGTATTLGELTYSASIPSIDMDFPTGEKVQMSNLVGEGQGIQQNGFWIGQQKMTMEQLNTQDTAGDSPFSAKQASYEFTSTLDESKQRFSSQHIIKIGELVNESGKVNDVQIDFTLGDVDSQSFAKLSDIYQENPDMSQQAISEALPYVDILFAKGFKVSMNKMALKVGEGEFDSNWSFAIPEGTKDVLQDPSVILSALTGNLDTFVSTQLAADYPFVQQGVDELVMMEMATQNEKGYQLKADVKDGNLVFANGQQVPLVALLVPLMMQQGY
ncbi:DUF945 family protein [Vibrio fluvialis]|uniref:DUF945 family protein n=1 Tax=Vibrio fluvialis TaxID=676 RepID=UPI001ABDC6E7|nr:DUF945 family protein [Vibrio fluvialis]EKO3468798.1 DUF945 family protein [Vibrio fluvialis]MBY7771091.1 DUF945 family protein [Vibrio fluvialis]MBY8095836.1 DUF945 family protein [Vibrio fluvialis]MCE7595039.1 DUF945 family protein [Vibrio fluvialis]QTG91092.1 DUF945 family protein [Vibrio fluvialis]